MKNVPNMFRVSYRVMEGDNYAGGWGNRTADVRSLADVARFKNVVQVRPIFVEIGDVIDQADIDKVIIEHKEAEYKRLNEKEAARLREQLAIAEAKLQE